MKKFTYAILVLAVMMTMFTVGCKDDDSTSPSVTQFETLRNYMDNNGMTITDLTTGWIIAADSTFQAVYNNFFFFIRHFYP